MGDSSRNIKQVVITGTALQDLKMHQGGGKRRAIRRLPRTTAKIQKVQEGGDTVPGQSLAAAANYAAAAKISQSMKGGSAAAAATPTTMPGTQPQVPALLKTPAIQAAIQSGTAIVPASSSAPAVQQQQQQQQGGKLKLLPAKKKKTAKLHLAPPTKTHPQKSTSVTKTRKIRVQLAGFKKRMTKAKTITKDSREKPITEIRALLEEARLVKPAKEGKTVPETVLRDIYKDYLLLRNRAL
jgi:hypothetical protein